MPHAVCVGSPGFASLRDGTPSTDPNINARRTLFKGIFASLATAGVEQSSLQLAWDFTVGTTKSVTQRMVAARDDAMSRLAAGMWAKLRCQRLTARSPAVVVARGVCRRVQVHGVLEGGQCELHHCTAVAGDSADAVVPQPGEPRLVGTLGAER